MQIPRTLQLAPKQNQPRNDPYIDKLFSKVFYPKGGGLTRINIIDSLLRQPANINQLAKNTGYHYKTVKHHMQVLQSYQFVNKIGNNYGTMYFPSENLENNLHILPNIINREEKKIRTKKVYY